MPLVGVKFNGKHSFDDYGLYLAHQEIGFPKVKTEYLSVPGTDGVLDYTEALTGVVKYGQRTIKLTFKAMDKDLFWASMLPEFVGDIHGQRVFLLFDDDQNHIYIGRAYVDPAASQKYHGIISVSVECDPYRYGYDSTREMDWQWDDVLENDAIIYYGTFDVAGEKARTLINPLPTPATPTIICGAAMTATMNGTTVQLAAGTNTPQALTLSPGKNLVTFAGTGRVLVDYAVSVEGARVL